MGKPTAKPPPKRGGSFSLWRVLKMLAAFPLILIMLAFVARHAPAPSPSHQAPVASKPITCPPIGEGALWLPDDKAYALKAFTSKAERLNASGVCVLDGGWGQDHQKFYYSVSRPEDMDKAWKWQHARYTYAELSR